MLLKLVDQGDETETLMIDATHLKAHRAATSMWLKKGDRPPDRAYRGRDELQTPCRH